MVIYYLVETHVAVLSLSSLRVLISFVILVKIVLPMRFVFFHDLIAVLINILEVDLDLS